MMNKIGGALCFVMGIALMGSDGTWFPWINLMGVLVFLGCIYFSRAIGRTYNGLE